MAKNIQEYVVQKVIEHIDEKQELLDLISELSKHSKIRKINCLHKNCESFIILVSFMRYSYKTDQYHQCRYCHLKGMYCDKHKSQNLKSDPLDDHKFLCKDESECFISLYRYERNENIKREN